MKKRPFLQCHHIVSSNVSCLNVSCLTRSFLVYMCFEGLTYHIVSSNVSCLNTLAKSLYIVSSNVSCLNSDKTRQIVLSSVYVSKHHIVWSSVSCLNVSCLTRSFLVYMCFEGLTYLIVSSSVSCLKVSSDRKDL